MDYLLHVNPRLKQCAPVMIHNPLPVAAQREVSLPLYYTGLTNAALIREQNGKPKRCKLDRAFSVRVPVKVPADGRMWLAVESP